MRRGAELLLGFEAADLLKVALGLARRVDGLLRGRRGSPPSGVRVGGPIRIQHVEDGVAGGGGRVHRPLGGLVRGARPQGRPGRHRPAATARPSSKANHQEACLGEAGSTPGDGTAEATQWERIAVGVILVSVVASIAAPAGCFLHLLGLRWSLTSPMT